MGFSSMDDLLLKTTVNGQSFRADWNKLTHAVTAQAITQWYTLFHSAGNPTNGVLTAGTNLSFQSLCEESTGAIRHGGNVSPNTKHILNVLAYSGAATSAPTNLVLVDMLGYIPITTVTTTGDQAIINTATVTFTNATNVMNHAAVDIASFTRIRFTTSGALPAELSVGVDYWTVRQSASTSLLATSYQNAVAGTTIDLTTDGSPTTTATMGLPRYTTGAGVRAFLTPTTVMGAATPNIRLTYTDSDGNLGNLTPGTLPVGLTASPVGHISYSGVGAGKYGPYFPLATGDKGIQKIEQFNLSASYISGVLALCLCREILRLPIPGIGVAAERDCINQIPSLPQIYDGACLSWLMVPAVATPVSTNFYGHIDLGWG